MVWQTGPHCAAHALAGSSVRKSTSDVLRLDVDGVFLPYRRLPMAHRVNRANGGLHYWEGRRSAGTEVGHSSHRDCTRCVVGLQQKAVSCCVPCSSSCVHRYRSDGTHVQGDVGLLRGIHAFKDNLEGCEGQHDQDCWKTDTVTCATLEADAIANTARGDI